MSHMCGGMCRSFKSKFSGTKYTLSAMPVSGGSQRIDQMLKEGLKSVVDSEVYMFDKDLVTEAINKVNSHKTRGRLIFVTNKA